MFDRQSKGFGTENSTSGDGFCSIKEATERRVLMESSSASRENPALPPPAIHHRKISAAAPPAAELEDFFAEAEKYVQKRFAEKYNYDIAKDLPLEGRYQWVRLHS